MFSDSPISDPPVAETFLFQFGSVAAVKTVAVCLHFIKKYNQKSKKTNEDCRMFSIIANIYFFLENVLCIRMYVGPTKTTSVINKVCMHIREQTCGCVCVCV